MEELFSIEKGLCLYLGNKCALSGLSCTGSEIQFYLLVLIQRQDKLEIESSGLIDMETRKRIQSVRVRDSVYLEM